jgi:preprotein translocase subunit SecD
MEMKTMTKLQASTIGAVLVAGVAIVFVFQQQSKVKLREENESLQRQISRLQSDKEGFSNLVVRESRSTSLDSDRLRELLRLRGEVTLLRRRQQELQLAAAQPKSPGTPGQPDSHVPPQPNKPAPFQVQIVVDEPGQDSETMTNNASGAREETLYVQKTPLMDQTAVSSAAVTTDPTSGAPQIDLEFSDVGRALFAAITKENINKRLAIVLDGQLYSAPVIRSEISGGRAVVTGAFTQQEARELVSKISQAIPMN